MTAVFYHLALPQAIFANPAASILLPVTIGAAVGYSTRPNLNDEFALSLKQPPFRPSPAAFGPVWTTLYGLMGYAAYRAVGVAGPLQVPQSTRLLGAGLYTLQLGLNFAWMPLFFRLHRPLVATADAAALFGINAYLALLWGRSVDSVAGWCMAPYVVWLGLATYISAGVTYLNWDAFKAKRA